jgi:spore coat polysaccharide biosynthesis predicted glycosyltransferase SpsG
MGLLTLVTAGRIGASVDAVVLSASTSMYELLSMRVESQVVGSVRTDTTRADETIDNDRLATLAILNGDLLG